MNKKFAATIALTVILMSFVNAAQARNLEIRNPTLTINKKTNDSSQLISDIVTDKEFTARSLTLSKNTDDLRKAVSLTSQNIGKTWYVFAGSTPRGWDCSGLVRWTYGHLGFDLYHGATAQMKTGRLVTEPKYGDIVGFKYKKSSRYYHVGIYISEDLMLHSGGKRGDKTELKSISQWSKDNYNSTIEYSRLIETN
jgi:cell wall-associated NlpC family hydrolase